MQATRAAMVALKLLMHGAIYVAATLALFIPKDEGEALIVALLILSLTHASHVGRAEHEKHLGDMERYLILREKLGEPRSQEELKSFYEPRDTPQKFPEMLFSWLLAVTCLGRIVWLVVSHWL